MPAGKRPIRVLYIVYWGLAEPLGQSLVLPAVERLARSGVELTLVTFDKPADLSRRDEIARRRARLAASGVRWIALRYHKNPKVPATAFDLAQGCARGLLERLRRRPDIVHARTYVGGLIGSLLAPVLGAKLVFHNEGFYPDEQVDGGVWRADGMPHRVARTLENGMYARADGLITLSHRARAVVEALPAVLRKGTPTIVVPSCVDLEHFVGNAARPVAPFRLVYIGSIGQRYLFRNVARFFAVAQRELGGATLRVLTRAEPSVVREALTASGALPGSWSVAAVPHEDIPAELADQHAGLFFLTQGTSEHGCSPTKIGEYWAMGLPVVTTPNVSDTDAIVRQERVGVIVHDHGDDEYRRAARELRSLLEEAGLAERCRRAAEAHYSLDAACDRQLALYQRLVPALVDRYQPSPAGEDGRAAAG